MLEHKEHVASNNENNKRMFHKLPCEETDFFKGKFRFLQKVKYLLNKSLDL